MTQKVTTKKMNKMPAKDLFIISLTFMICIYLACNTIKALNKEDPEMILSETTRVAVNHKDHDIYEDITLRIKRTAETQENIITDTETEAQTETIEKDIYSNFKLSQKYKIECLESDGVIFPEGAEWGTHEPLFYDVELSDELQYYTYELCIAYGVGEYYDIILGIMANESTYTADAVSKTNDYGIMQINKINHKWISEEIGIYDYLNPEQGILAGIHYAAPLLNKYPNDTQYALLCYRRGPTGAKRYRDKGYISDSYADRVIKYSNELTERS